MSAASSAAAGPARGERARALLRELDQLAGILQSRAEMLEARVPQIPVHWGWIASLTILMFGAVVACRVAIGKTTRFA